MYRKSLFQKSWKTKKHDKRSTFYTVLYSKSRSTKNTEEINVTSCFDISTAYGLEGTD